MRWEDDELLDKVLAETPAPVGLVPDHLTGGLLEFLCRASRDERYEATVKMFGKDEADRAFGRKP